MAPIQSLMQKYLNNVDWNIGFAEGLTPAKLLEYGKMGSIQWLKHKYRDRAFADPHIFAADDKYITLLCEEIVFGEKGKISRLLVERNGFRLKDKKILLELPTHLSYPAIIEDGGSIYMYPENSESGQLRRYRYDPQSETLEEDGIMADGDVADFTICDRQIDGRWYALCTRRHPDSLENAFLYYSENRLGPYRQSGEAPVVTSRACSRPGGNFFTAGGGLYRPAQDCTLRYGGALKIMRVKSFAPYREEEVMSINPTSFRYYRGIHTLNFGKDFAVTDGYGHLYPAVGVIARMAAPLNRLRLRLTR